VVDLLGLRNLPSTVLSALSKPVYHGILRIHGKKRGSHSVWSVCSVVDLLGLRNLPSTVLSALSKPIYRGILRIHGKSRGSHSMWSVAIGSTEALEEP
jgi:ribosomal protein L30/L7E